MNDSATRGERLIKIVRRYADLYEEVCKKSQIEKITPAHFDELKQLISTDRFCRTGVFKDEADWPLCLQKYVQFAGTSLWTGTVRHMNVAGNIVFQELEETITRPHGQNVIYTMSVYEFDDNDKIIALRVYMQQSQDVQNVLILGTEAVDSAKGAARGH